MAIERIQVLDYAALGRKIVEWATAPDQRPEGIAELRTQLEGIAIFPDRIEKVEFVDNTLDKFIFRLPPKEMLVESVDRVRSEPENARYRLPGFYDSDVSNEEWLFSRIGDYSISQCA